MNKLNPWRTGGAAAVCLSPDGTASFVNSWLHGLGLAAIRSDKPWIPGGLALGLFNAALTAFLVGVLFASWHEVPRTSAKGRVTA